MIRMAILPRSLLPKPTRKLNQTKIIPKSVSYTVFPSCKNITQVFSFLLVSVKKIIACFMQKADSNGILEDILLSLTLALKA